MKRSFFVNLRRARTSIHTSESADVAFVPTNAFDNESARLIVEQLRKLGYSSEDRVILGLPSQLFFFLSIDQQRNSSSVDTLAFDLELELPIAAESMVVSRIESTVVVLNLDPIQAFVRILYDEYDLRFASVIPTSLIVAKGINDKLILQNQESRRLVVLDQADSRERFGFQNGNMNLWTYLKASGDSDVHEPVDEHALVLNYVEGEVHCPGEVDPTRPSLARFVQSEIEKNPGYDFADGVSERLGIHMQRTSIAELYVISIAVGFLLIAAALFLRSNQWRDVAARANAEMRREFREALPDQRINGPIEKLLRANVAKQKHATELFDKVDDTAKVLDNFNRFFSSLPSDIPVDLDSLTVSPGECNVTGRVKTLDNLDALRDVFLNAGFAFGADSKYGKDFTLQLLSGKQSQ